jgi:hypothetical protein
VRNTQHYRFCCTYFGWVWNKAVFLPAPAAEAEVRNSLDISRMHVDKNLPVQYTRTDTDLIDQLFVHLVGAREQ